MFVAPSLLLLPSLPRYNDEDHDPIGMLRSGFPGVVAAAVAAATRLTVVLAHRVPLGGYLFGSMYLVMHCGQGIALYRLLRARAIRSRLVCGCVPLFVYLQALLSNPRYTDRQLPHTAIM